MTAIGIRNTANASFSKSGNQPFLIPVGTTAIHVANALILSAFANGSIIMQKPATIPTTSTHVGINPRFSSRLAISIAQATKIA